MILDTQWTIEFYEGGFLSPLKEIDAVFDLPKEVLALRRLGLLERAEALAHAPTAAS